MKSQDSTSIKVELLRNTAGLKQKQLASLLQIDQTYLSKIERGKVEMQEVHVNRLCKLYGFQIQDFMELEAHNLAAIFCVYNKGKLDINSLK